MILLLAGALSYSGFSMARERLADEFAEEQYLISLYTARHLQSKFDTAGLCLHVLGHRLVDPEAPARLGESEALAHETDLVQAMLDQRQATFFVSDAGGQLVQLGGARQRPPVATVSATLARVVRSHRTAAELFRADDGSPRLLVMQELEETTADAGVATGVVLDLRWLLRPPSQDKRTPNDIILVDPANLVVLASLTGLREGLRLFDLYRTETEALRHAVTRMSSGRERDAWRLVGTESGRPERYLVGVQGLALGDRKLAVMAGIARRHMVERFFNRIARWIVLIGLITLLSSVAMASLVLQTNNRARDDRRRSEERNALLRISQALFAEHGVSEVLRRITNEAVDLFRCDGATIALLDETDDTLVFRCVSSRDPATAERLTGLRLPRDQGVLGWVVTHGEAARVDNAADDQRYSRSVDEETGKRTMALLCAPLTDEKGRPFGAIELVNHIDHPFAANDLPLLLSLAATASAALERAVFLERQAEQDRLQRELDIAATVQRSLLPQSFPELPGFEVAGDNDPAREVGGDFYGFVPVDDNHLGVAIADVADKGLGAAMFMVMCHSLLHTVAPRELSPAKVLADLNTRLLELSNSDLFVTVFYGILDLRTGQFRYSNAGHPPPLWSHADGSLTPVTLRGMALGVVPDVDLGEDELTLQAGDRLLLYTDGITDALNPAGQELGLDAVTRVLSSRLDLSAAETVAALMSATADYAAGRAQFDDTTVTVVRATPPATQV